MAISSSSTGLRPGVCTSTTRPTTPYTGQIIYETDTGYLRVWDGAAWDYLSQKQDTTSNLPLSTLGTWASYTPALTASTTNPTIGTGGNTQTGSYVQINKLVTGFAYIAFGSSGAAAGSGSYRVSIPVAPASTQIVCGHAWFYDSSAGFGYSGICTLPTTSSYVEFYNGNGNAIGVTNSAPFTWAGSDQIRCMFTYQAA